MDQAQRRQNEMNFQNNGFAYRKMAIHIEIFNIKDLCTTLVNLTTEEPDAGKPLVRVCGGAGRQQTALPGESCLSHRCMIILASFMCRELN